MFRRTLWKAKLPNDSACVAEGLAQFLVPEPLNAVAVLAARALAEVDSDALKQRLLWCLAASEENLAKGVSRLRQYRR